MFINIPSSSVAHLCVKLLILLLSPHYGILLLSPHYGLLKVIIDWTFSLFLTCFSKLSPHPYIFLH